MTDYDITDLAVCYPFLPAGTFTPDAIRNIRDVRLAFALPAADYSPSGGCLECALVEVTSAALTFSLRCTGLDGGAWHAVTVPVFTGAVPQATVSYALTYDTPHPASFDDPSQVPSGTFRYLHPNCIRLVQQAPSVLSADNASGQLAGGSRIPGTEVDLYLAASLAFSDGLNTGAYLSGSAVVLNAYAGGGTGHYSTANYPYFTASGGSYERIQLHIGEADGLRSINGHYGDVRIAGHSIITVKTSCADSAGARVITASAIRGS